MQGTARAGAAGEALRATYLELERRLPRPRSEYERMLDELNEALGAVMGGTPATG